MREWAKLPSNGSNTYKYDWNKHLADSVTVSSVSYSLDPNAGVTAVDGGISGGVATVTLTATNASGYVWLKMTPTLSSGSTAPVSRLIEVREHVR